MLLIPTDRLHEGDSTATAVAHPQRPGSCLLQRNVNLTASLIGRLRDMGLQWAWINRDGFEHLDSRIGVHIPARRTELFTLVSENFAQISRRGICKEDFDTLCEAAALLVADMYENGGDAGVPSERLFNNNEEYYLHTAQVAYLSIAIGRKIQEYILGQRGQGAASGAAELAALGGAAMLHDIAKISWDKESNTKHSLDSDQNKKYLEHPLEGFRMLSGKLNALAGAVCLQHHQRWDGSGWPDMTKITRGRIEGALSGENIHIYARIVAAANLFDTLTTSQYAETGKMFPAIYALSAMQSEAYAGSFDPVILHAFLCHAQAFPLGAEVILSDGRECGVINQTEDPCRPRVQSSKGEKINLSTNKSLFINYSQGFDVSEWLFPKPVNPLAEVS